MSSDASVSWRTCWSPPNTSIRGGPPRGEGPVRRESVNGPRDCSSSSALLGWPASRAANLSYGQRKLLELAYVLMSDPELLLLDEPAGGVNPTLLNAIAHHIRELNKQGRTFLVVEHNMEFVMALCHRVTVMDHGSIVVSGLPEQVRNNPKVLDAYLGTADEDDEESDAFHH